MFLKCQSDFALLRASWPNEIRHKPMLGNDGFELRKANRGIVLGRKVRVYSKRQIKETTRSQRSNQMELQLYPCHTERTRISYLTALS